MRRSKVRTMRQGDLAQGRRLAESDPNARRPLALELMLLGDSLLDHSPALARPLFEEAVHNLHAAPPHPGPHDDLLGMALERLGDARTKEGNDLEARDAYAEAFALVSQLPYQQDVGIRITVALRTFQLAEASRRCGDKTEALRLFQDAFARWNEIVSEPDSLSRPDAMPMWEEFLERSKAGLARYAADVEPRHPPSH